MVMEPWFHELERGQHDAAWDGFLSRYRRLIVATVRHYAHQHDDVMDVFTHVCEALRADGMARLRRYSASGKQTARFSTWLVVVVRNLAIDWYRSREGRQRLSAAAERLPLLQQAIFREVFLRGSSHAETYEIVRSRESLDLTFGSFLRELAAVYRAVGFRHTNRAAREIDADPSSLSLDAPDGAFAAEVRQILNAALAELSPTERLAVQLYVIDELPAADIARTLGLANAKAVYNCVYRALAGARADLERAGYRRDML
jgi:RNA polymerase sigma factor (sigma-70 family)